MCRVFTQRVTYVPWVLRCEGVDCFLISFLPDHGPSDMVPAHCALCRLLHCNSVSLWGLHAPSLWYHHCQRTETQCCHAGGRYINITVQWNMKEVKLNLVWNKHKFSFCFNTTSTVQSSKFDFELLVDFLYTVLSQASAKIWGWAITRRKCFNGSTIPAQGPTPDAKLAAMGLNGLASSVNTSLSRPTQQCRRLYRATKRTDS